MLTDKGINKVIAGKFGDKMIDVLNIREIKFEETQGNIKDFIDTEG